LGDLSIASVGDDLRRTVADHLTAAIFDTDHTPTPTD
jgi:hypothetical protein